MKQERSKIKSDILLRVRLLYVLFILAGLTVFARLVWVQLFSAEVAYNADRLASRIFTEETIPAQRGSILSRNGAPLATSIFRYQAAFDFASPGLDSLKTFREQSDSLAKLLSAFFKDKPASEYARRFREEHARRYRLVNGRVAGAGHEDPVDGYDIVTTLDLDLQDVADKALRRQLEAQNAIWGTTIVMEVETGEILAMANLGRSGSSGGSYYERENYALGRSMEPGSTFKLATMLTLLDDAGMSPETTYDTHNGDPVTVGPARNIRDSHRGDHVIGFRRAVASSSNVYFAKAIWDRYGITGKKQEYSDFLHEKLHLGKTVGLERLGERAPSITADWKVPDPGVMLVKMSYGYRVRLAPIQMITFYNAIANGGKMISPVLIRELRRGDRVEERFETQTIASSICSRAALREVQRCLELVCTQGTASLYFKDSTRLRVAAKTGTAQITDARSREGRYYLGSMVAYFPADNPRYTVLTTIETRAQPGKAYYGGPLAGPVVKRMVDYIYNRNRDWYGRVERHGGRCYPGHVKGGDIAQIRRVADKFSPRASFDQRTGWGRARVDSLSNVIITSLPPETGTMPDVRGMGLKDALFVLESRGLKVRFSGVGAVTQQSIPAGARITPGSTVGITLK